jgi:hypothetical protein
MRLRVAIWTAWLAATAGCVVMRATPPPINEGHGVAVDPGGHQAALALGLDGVGPGTLSLAGDVYVRATPSLDVHVTGGGSTTLASLEPWSLLFGLGIGTADTVSAGLGVGLRGRVRLGSGAASPTLGLGAGLGGNLAEADTTSASYGAWGRAGLAFPMGPGSVFVDLGGSFSRDQWRLEPRRGHLVAGYWARGDRLARSAWVGIAVQRGGLSCVDRACPWGDASGVLVGPRVGVTVERVRPG